MSAFKKPLESERNQDATLYIGNLDPQVNEAILYELFIQFAPLKTLNLPKDKILKTHMGYGFVEFQNTNDCEYVDHLLNGIRLFGKPMKLKKSSIEKNKNLDIGAILFLKNLNPLIDEKFLSDTFKKFGNFNRSPMVVRDEQGNSKKYGFLYYLNFEDSDNVIKQMNNQYLMNEKIEVDYSFKKNGKDKHGDSVERLLSKNAQKNNYIIGQAQHQSLGQHREQNQTQSQSQNQNKNQNQNQDQGQRERSGRGGGGQRGKKKW